ncbi:hypothetical protein K8Z49_32500 [Actinomadura madurae]|uniref:hypothetical protein n=1 Tax=Actinomadura madurae TaxID=1993 RepID=UPI0039995B1D
MGQDIFQAGQAYDNVYFLFLDAAGYSSIVNLNPRDRVAHAFEVLRARVIAGVKELAAKKGCARVALWNWRGDGGFLVIHDEQESVARDVALEAGWQVLAVYLPQLREEFAKDEFQGELHLRMAIHKGPIEYLTADDTGAIHSPHINFTAHLEEATPQDHLAVSEDIYRVSGRYASSFQEAGSFEGRKVYLMGPGGQANDARRAWLRVAGLSGGVRLAGYAQRPSQQEKARLVAVAYDDVLDIGTALNTCAGYLVTTERPAYYREAVLDFLRRGGTYRCVVLDPGSEAAELCSRLWQEDLATKCHSSLERFDRFKRQHGEAAERLQVYQTDELPGAAALCIDAVSPEAMILYSPYMLTVHSSLPPVERADMPHYLATSGSGGLFEQVRSLILNAVAPERLERVL